jgi:DNA-binding response OmpR family regulator
MPKKILLVEDDLTIQSAYKLVLEMEGFEAMVAGDGQQALELAEANEPDLILLDMLMPNVDGLAFLKSYQQKTKHPNVKIVAFSNMSIPESKKQALELGAIEYLAKSTFTPRDMVAKIKALMV